MPALLDFICPFCSTLEPAVFFGCAAEPRTHVCPSCGIAMEILWSGRSASTGFEKPIEFEDDDGTTYHFQTPEEVHRFERRTEDEWRAGCRPRPFVFRELSQSLSSHRDRNVFQHLHPQVPRDKLVTRGRDGRRLIEITGGVDAAHAFGDPGQVEGED